MKKIVILTLCIFVTTLSAQQNNSANWTHHQFLDEINDIAETENDMWFATNTGLVRMNKTTFDRTVYHPYNSPLPRQHIEALAVDAAGQLFIGIYDNIVARFDGNDDWDIIDLPVDESQVSISQMPQLYTIFIDDDNEKWVGTNSGLLHQQTDGNWEIFNDSTLGNSGVVSFGEVWDITQTDNGDLFISSFEIYKYDGDSFVNLSEGNADLFSYGGTSIESHGNDVWFNEPQSLSARYSEGTWEIYETEGEVNGLPSGVMSDLKLDQFGTPYVSYTSANLDIHKFENNIWTPVDDAQVNEIPEGITSIYFDGDGERWLTTDNDVFFYISNISTQMTLEEGPLADNLPRFVREASDESIYCYSGSLFEGKLVKFSSPTEWEEIDFSDNFGGINDLEITTDGNLIVSSVQGVFQYQNETWTIIADFPASIPNQIALDTENGIWVSTSTSGLYYYDGNAWTTYTSANSGLTSDFLNSVSVDRNDGVWVVTENQNLEHFDGTSWEIFNQANAMLPESLDNTDIYFDENNELWFPIFNFGIFHFDGTTWENFVPEFVNTFRQRKIAANAEGTLYVASSWGIYEFTGTTWQPFLNEENSLLLDQISTDLLIDQNGFFWISTSGGLFIYDTEIIAKK